MEMMMGKTRLAEQIEARINAEYRKHKDIDWAKIASIKIVHMILTEVMPTEEEIDDRFNISPDNHIHPDRYRAEGARWYRNRMKGKVK